MPARKVIAHSIAWCCTLVLGTSVPAFAQVFDISSGGLPSITGDLGGFVSGATTVGQTLSVAVNFGEVSPANRNRAVVVTVPVAIRASRPYQVIASASMLSSTDAAAVQPADIGVGAINLRPFGAQPRDCTTHTIHAPFGNNPDTTAQTDASGRIVYPTSIVALQPSATIASGPAPGVTPPATGVLNGYMFDFVLTIRPQFFSAGAFSASIVFTIGEGPDVPCR